MKNLFKIAIRVVPIFAILVLAYILYLNFYGDRSYNNWFGSRKNADIKAESEKAERIFESYNLLLSKLNQKNSLADISEKNIQNNIEVLSQFRNDSLKILNAEYLDSTALLNFFVCEKDIDNRIADLKNKHYYLLNPFDGMHLAPFLTLKNLKIKNEEDIKKYLNILNESPIFIDNLISAVQYSERDHSLAPRYILQKAKSAINNLIIGYPLSNTYKKNQVLLDLEKKLETLILENNLKKNLIDSCKTLLIKVWQPSYNKLISYIDKVELKALNSPGISRIENGDERYLTLLKKYSNTSLSPEEILNIAKDEIAKIQDSLKVLLVQNNLTDYFNSIRNSKIISDKDFQQKIYSRFLNPEPFPYCKSYFLRCPDSIQLPKPIISEMYSEYNKIVYSDKKIIINSTSSPSLSLLNDALFAMFVYPGQFYLNISLPESKYFFRKQFPGHEAYKEGWNLYALELATESGQLKNKEDKVAKLLIELNHLTNLFVDLSIHNKRWTRDQAIIYYKKNSTLSDTDIINMVDRIISYPARLVAPIIGKLSIMELRKKASNALGDLFDIKTFHNVIIRKGPLPIDLLEDQVDEYIRSSKSSAKK